MKKINIYKTLSLGKLLLIFGGLLLFDSCTQKFEPKPLTYSQLLTGTDKKTWVFSALTIVDQKDPFELKGSQVLSACQLDDQFVFYANEEKKLEYTNGSSKCSSTEKDIIFTDTWVLKNATAELQMAVPRIFGGYIYPFVVKSLTANKMELELYFGDIDASYRLTFTSTGS